jgi:CubicO group peptidase (beta-lactamase class C family)
MLHYIDEESIAIDSVIVIRHGYIVLEEYPTSTYDVNRSHLWYSVTKGFTSALVGIAIDNGYIDNVSQKVLSFFPDRNITNWDERKESITLEHLLTMHSGIFWDESPEIYWDEFCNIYYISPESGIYHLIFGDGTQYVLELDMVSEPGEEFRYSEGVSHLLSAIVQQTTGLTALEFAHEHLFGPLGITEVWWQSDATGVTNGAFNLSIRSRDAAKFGYLFLNNGTWDSEQIISLDWVKISTSTFIEFNAELGYGYQWWTNPAFDYYYAAGLFAQFIFVVPSQDLVVVFSSSIAEEYTWPNEMLLQDYILTAIQEDTSPVPRFDPFIATLLVACTVPIAVVVLYWVYRTRRR